MRITSNTISNPINSQAIMATISPPRPRPSHSTRSNRLPMYPPPAAAWAATLAISGAAITECIAVSSHT